MATAQMPNNYICSQCSSKIKTANFVRCFNCDRSFHFSPCCSLSESSYKSMGLPKKTEWKCHICNPRAKSPNNVYVFVNNSENETPQIQEKNTEQQMQSKQQRDGDDNEETASKRFKNNTTTTTTSSNEEILKQNKDISDLKSGMIEMQNCIKQLTINITTTTTNITNLTMFSGEIKEHIADINRNVAIITTQIQELQLKDQQKSEKIKELTERIEKMEQKSLERNIEIGNITNENIEVIEVLRQISESVGVPINNTDINKAYKIKRKNKISVEFVSLNKKREVMDKIKRHRVEIKIPGQENNTMYYVNDELTAHNKHLLWLTKIKAKESNWKYVWVKNGNIYARKNENSPFTIIRNTSDIENITEAN